jgi:hypothetical protein
MLLTVSPWLVYQARITGQPGLGTEHGISLYRGASPLLFSRYPEANVDEALALIERQMRPALRAERDALANDPAAQDAWYLRQAWAEASANWPAYLTRAFRKLAIAFGPLFSPRHGALYDAVYALCWLPLLALGFAGWWRDREHRRRNLLFAAHFAGFSAVTALVWAQTSHRSYLDAYLMIFAAPSLLALLPKAVRRRLDLTQPPRPRSYAPCGAASPPA